MHARLIAVSVLLLASSLASADEAAYVWWEAESPRTSTFPERSWFDPQNDAERAVLSGGDWLTSGGKLSPAPAATWDALVPEKGRYDLWARVFWKHGPFRWRVGRGRWETCGRDRALADTVELRQHVCANWVRLGAVDLAKGRTEMAIELLVGPGEEATAAFDCFLLTREPFVPRGKMKPDERYRDAPPGWFAFDPPPAGDDPLLDLSGLNQDEAGEDGRIEAKGDRLVFERSGEEVRLLGVNLGGEVLGLDEGSLAHLARFLARLGVNAVRLHAPIARADDPERIDEARLAGIHRTVAAMKREGIYSALSFYFPVWYDITPAWGIPGFESSKNKKPFGLVFFHPRMQELHRGWLKQLLTPKNPGTGKRLADDPAVAFVEMVNEDNLFFWTFNPHETIPAEAMRPLEEAFGRWAAKRYGSLDRALSAWGGRSAPGDAPREGRLGLLGAWFLTTDGRAQGGERAKAQARFLFEVQRGFFDDAAKYARTKLKYRGLTVATNWKAADPRVGWALDAAACAACPVLDAHGYFGGEHEGPRAGWSVSEGDVYRDRSALTDPATLPIQSLQLEGMPQVISELGWPRPNRFRPEMPLLTASYLALQGVDAVFLFAADGPSWAPLPGKFGLSTPAGLGQLPAAARIFREGLVREAPAVVLETLAFDDVADLSGGAIAPSSNLDGLRKVAGRGDATGGALVSPLAFYAGRVVRRVVPRGRSDLEIAPELEGAIDVPGRVVRSVTGELAWDFGRGIVRIDTPRAQAALGFLEAAKGPIQLSSARFALEAPYAMAAVVSLDGEPIDRSGTLLLQVMSEEQPTGWRTSDAGGGRRRIDALGRPPLIVREIGGHVAVARARPGALRVQPLDASGRPKGEAVRVEASGDRPEARIALRPDVLWYRIEADRR